MKSPLPQREQLRQLRLKKFKQKLIQRRKEAAKKAFMAYRKSAWRQMDSERQTQRKERVKSFRKSAGLASPRSPSGWEYRVRNWKCNTEYPTWNNVSPMPGFKTPRSDISNQETKFRSPLRQPEPKIWQPSSFGQVTQSSHPNYASLAPPQSAGCSNSNQTDANSDMCTRSFKVLRTSFYEDAASSSKRMYTSINSHRSHM